MANRNIHEKTSARMTILGPGLSGDSKALSGTKKPAFSNVVLGSNTEKIVMLLSAHP